MAMSKKTVYTLFVAKFVFSMAMIFWTLSITIGAGVGSDDDTTFMSYYQNVDEDFNQIVSGNQKFEEKYRIEVGINNFLITKLEIQDIYLSQRVIKQRTDKKNILNVGDNIVKIKVYDKKTNKLITDYKTEIVFTMPSSHKYNVNLEILNNTSTNLLITKKTFWNIMGKIKVDDNIGHFIVKTNAN